MLPAVHVEQAALHGRGVFAPHGLDCLQSPCGAVTGDQPRRWHPVQERGVGGGVFGGGPLPGDHLTAFVHGRQQRPVVGEVDPVDEELVVDLPGHRQGRGGYVPAPRETAPRGPAGGRGVDLVLGVLAEHIIEERSEGSLLCLILATEGIRGRTVGASPPLRTGCGTSVLPHRLGTDLTFTSFGGLGSHRSSRPAHNQADVNNPP